MFTVTFEHRDTRAPRLVPGVDLRVERLEWRALGGPWTARISARAESLARLWSLAGLLGCGLTVQDAGGPAWWGYAAAVTLRQGARGVRLSLDELANSVAARYRAFTPEAAGGAWAVTAFTGDPRSIAIYGEKQRVIRAGQAAHAEAEACARALLARCASPTPQTVLLPGADGPGAWIEARGWWETLDWRIAAEPRGRIASPWTGAEQPFGDPLQQKAAQRFRMGADPWAVSEAWLRLRRVGGPTDSARLELCADSGGSPGAALGSASLPAAQIGDDWGWARFAFAAPLALAPGSYWLVLSRGGPLSNAQYYLASADEGCRLGEGAGPGTALVFNGAAWAARAPAAVLSLYINGVEETTEQVRRLLQAERCGQFLRGARMEAASGVQARLYREGAGASEPLRGRAVIERLLERGTMGGERLLARIEPDRTARVYAQPAAQQAALAIGAAGDLRSHGRPVLPSEQPAGQWARLEDLAPAGQPLPGMPTAVFIERCVWEGGRLRIVR